MSHIVTIRTQVRDVAALTAACRRLGLAEPIQGTAKLYAAEAAGQVVQLPGWNYPVVADPVTGQLHYDNFSGHWGEQRELDRCFRPMPARRRSWRHGGLATRSPSSRCRMGRSS